MRALTLLLALTPLPAFAGPLNDTGIDFCRDLVTGADTSVNASTTCTQAQGRQDARFGRDPAAARGVITKTGAGSKGFDFTKIGNNGTTLAAGAVLGSGATDWACTFDNHTGLMWEVKVDNPAHLRHQGFSYTWYDSVHNYGGSPGTASGTTNCLTVGRCDTAKFVADVNAANLCGHADWRMPSPDELLGIVDFGLSPAFLDAAYFPNTPWPVSVFWSGAPQASSFGNGAWIVLSDGSATIDFRSNPYMVRLVRTGP